MPSVTLAIPIMADSGNYEVALQRVKSGAAEAAKEIINYQKIIDSQFKAAGSNFSAELQRSVQMRQSIKESVLSTDPYHAATAGSWLPGARAGNGAEIQQRMAAEAELQDRLFKVKHSALENALRDHSAYFAELKMQYAGSEQMMTVITQTEEAERLKIREQYAQETQSKIAKFFRGGMRGFGTAALIVYGVDAAMKGMTAGIEASRKGEGSAGIALEFTKAIPLVGTVVTDTEKLLKSMLGVEQATEAWKKTLESITKFREIKVDIGKAIELLKMPTAERPAKQIQQSYDDQIKQLEKEKQAELASRAAKRQAETHWGAGGAVIGEQKFLAEKETWEVNARYDKAFKEAAAERDLKLAEAGKTLIEQLTREVDTYKMLSREIAIYDAAKAGASDADLAAARSKAKELDSLDAQKKAADELAESDKKIADASKTLVEQLTRERDTFGMSQRAIELYDAAKANVAPGALAAAAALAKELDAMDANKKKTDELADATKRVTGALSDVELEYRKLAEKMSEPVAKFADLLQGMTPEEIEANRDYLTNYAKALVKLDKEQKAVDAAKKSEDFGNQVRESLMTPLEQFKKYRDELEKTNLTAGEKGLALQNKMGELMDKGEGTRKTGKDFSVIENAGYMSMAAITQTREDPVARGVENLHMDLQATLDKLREIAANTKDGGVH